MDNLYNSAVLCKKAFNHKFKVLCHGVTRKGMCGIPSSVKQEEVKNCKEQIRVRGTVKSAILEGDPSCPNLVAASVYDTKPVQMLSMTCKELKWNRQEKPVYNVDTGQVELINFLRLNTINFYNEDMGNVDVADQLRGIYRCDIGVSNRKWWWSIWFWVLGVMLVNSYIMYLKVHLNQGRKKKDLIIHHDFRRVIAIYWINEEYITKKCSERETDSGTTET